ncbi:MAG: transcription antitermination factor NusB, partial [Deltaproteobacteria bacterium]|nr:transcription antitermination factor NusB [Deltaproteobacteria bacterium]
MNLRRKAREYALQILFQYDMTGSMQDLSERFWADKNVSPPVRDFADHLVSGVIGKLEEIDGIIRRYA